MRFIDGTHAQIVIDSPTDILLSPVFLKYMFFCIAVYSLLNSDPWDVGALSPWELMMLWSLVTATVIVWYVGALRVTHWLLSKGWIKTVFTPLIILPSLPLLQFLTYGVSVSLHDTYIPSADVIRTAIKDVFVLALFDMAFGSFVAPQHPAFICDHGNRTSAAPDADTGPSPRAILPTKPEASMLKLQGVLPALVTPFDADGQIDFAAFAANREILAKALGHADLDRFQRLAIAAAQARARWAAASASDGATMTQPAAVVSSCAR